MVPTQSLADLRSAGVASTSHSCSHPSVVPSRSSPGHKSSANHAAAATAESSEPLLLRVARGEEAERTPVWLMRQAGRYMPEFRSISERFGFRHRSETADMAIELSLQPWQAFQPDGVIMFSDILTPLPALGIEFDVIPKHGPKIETPIRSMEQVRELVPLDDPDSSLPFIRPILQSLRQEVGGASTVVGFVGSPWTLAAYSIEGSANKHCMATKKVMLHQPRLLHALLQHLTKALTAYICHQTDAGAQVVQIFDSWAHHLSPAQFAEFSMPYAEQIIQAVKEQRPDTPLIFHANGGTGKLDIIRQQCSAPTIGLDWGTSMADARAAFPASTVLQGNVDPMILFGPEEAIRKAVHECVGQAGPHRHILNVGHGVAQGTPPQNVGLFCELARQTGAGQPQRQAAAVL